MSNIAISPILNDIDGYKNEFTVLLRHSESEK